MYVLRHACYFFVGLRLQEKDDSDNEEVMSQAATLNLAYSAANATSHNGGITGAWSYCTPGGPVHQVNWCTM